MSKVSANILLAMWFRLVLAGHDSLEPGGFFNILISYLPESLMLFTKHACLFTNYYFHLIAAIS